MKRIIPFIMALLLLPAWAAGAGDPYAAYVPAAKKAETALIDALTTEREQVYIYKEYADTENHFTQKAKIAGLDAARVLDMDENWRQDPHSGESCIRCEQITALGDWGGWMFMNGMLAPGSSVPQLNDGYTDGQGLDLSGAEALRFFARGEKGGERVEFFTCGFGYDGVWDIRLVPYPDSAPKQTTGTVTLTAEWQEYEIDLRGVDTGYVVCGFGYVLSGEGGPGDQVFFLDDIRFTGSPAVAANGHYLLASHQTDNRFIQKTAFTYDNALAAMALLSAGHRAEAEHILDSLVYAVENDRYQPGRIRNAYAAGSIAAFSGWDAAARLPGWYDGEAGQWCEDRYQTGSNVGNTAYAALALLQYDRAYGSERYRKTAAALMDWVIADCGADCGFTAGYDGWPEGGPETTYVFTNKSIEHNIDAYAAFRRLYAVTGEEKYDRAAQSALAFVTSMYDAERGVFLTGTREDGVTPDAENTVLDAQVWACMALGEDFAPFTPALDTVAAMETAEGGYPFCQSNENGGWWAEGTAYTALMYRLLDRPDKAASALDALVSIQLESGLFPAATVDGLSTGIRLFDGSPWEYGADPHIAPTAWFVMAVNGFNPYDFE